MTIEIDAKDLPRLLNLDKEISGSLADIVCEHGTLFMPGGDEKANERYNGFMGAVQDAVKKFYPQITIYQMAYLSAQIGIALGVGALDQMPLEYRAGEDAPGQALDIRSSAWISVVATLMVRARSEVPAAQIVGSA
ncbi:MAG: hypothetical protein HC889_17350 [Synechococcaceae cyanobacterium SM1_2_3]|nr:hypothetical protein [Synechococcaceae cyanobacterium SM1_2_3]